MRLTVGPLSPAVYWRRRAVVLGVVLLFLLVLLYSCTGPGDSAQRPTAGSSPTSPAPATSAAAPTGSPSPARSDSDGSGTQSTGEQVVPAPPATSAAAPNEVVTSPDNGCTDAEMSVIPEPIPNSAQRGTVVTLRLLIKNVSNRTCNRNVGADLQEIFIKIGAQKVWSSDTCGTARGSDVRPFTPNLEMSYQVDWNGRDATKCANGVATGPFPAAGEYQVFGRLGAKISEPVKLSIVN